VVEVPSATPFVRTEPPDLAVLRTHVASAAPPYTIDNTQLVAGDRPPEVSSNGIHRRPRVSDPKKIQAKLQKAEAAADRERTKLRAKAEKKIARIKNELRAEESKIAAKVERKREKMALRLAAVSAVPAIDGRGSGRSMKARSQAR
jgi:hypothetical protein